MYFVCISNSLGHAGCCSNFHFAERLNKHKHFKALTVMGAIYKCRSEGDCLIRKGVNGHEKSLNIHKLSTDITKVIMPNLYPGNSCGLGYHEGLSVQKCNLPARSMAGNHINSEKSPSDRHLCRIACGQIFDP